MRNRQLTVSALVRYLKGKLDQDPLIQRAIVAGEISNFTAHRSGHWYFTLKDEKSRISCVMFASNAARCRFRPKEGDSVLVQANTSIFEASGQLQLYVTAMKPMGLGDLYQRFEELKRSLNAEGLFAPERKKALPVYPMQICVITGKNTAAREDVVTTLRRRWPVARVSEIPVLVQGETAAGQISEALKSADEMNFDVLILARGGGSIEDLWPFNEEIVARTLAGMKTPVICGVGHEVDVTIADLAADRRAPTPTGAAEMATPDIQEVKFQLTRQRRQLQRLMQDKLSLKRRELNQLMESRVLTEPESLLQDAQMHLAYNTSRLQNTQFRVQRQKDRLIQMSHRLTQSASRSLSAQRQTLQAQRLTLTHLETARLTLTRQHLSQKIQLLDAYSPLKILGRGYGLIYKENQLVRKSAQLQPGDVLTVKMQDGSVSAEVTERKESR